MKKVNKLDIADEMIEAAIEEFIDNKRHFAALNLAGVAEEIYGKQIRIAGSVDSLEGNIQAAAKVNARLGGSELSPKNWKRIFNFHKNSVKHYDSQSDQYVEINVEQEAEFMIEDALSNHAKLNRACSSKIQRFYDFVIENAQKNDL